MTEWRWLTRAMVEAFHRESVARFGGIDGVRDLGVLESALARPQNRAACGDDASVFDLAADCCLGIVSNHPFLDGNKRTGILAGAVFLHLNGIVFEPEETAIVQVIIGLAAGEVDNQSLTAWFQASSRPQAKR